MLVSVLCFNISRRIINELDRIMGGEAHEGRRHVSSESLLQLQNHSSQLNIIRHHLKSRVEVQESFSEHPQGSGCLGSGAESLDIVWLFLQDSGCE